MDWVTTLTIAGLTVSQQDRRCMKHNIKTW